MRLHVTAVRSRMCYSAKSAWRLLLAGGCFFSLFTCTVAAQEAGGVSPNVSPPTLSEQERRGEFLFIKSCPLCHIHDREREITGAFVTDLKGLFTNPRRTEEVVRELILGGMPDFGMPGFRYTLNPEQLDDLIAFLKTR